MRSPEPRWSYTMDEGTARPTAAGASVGPGSGGPGTPAAVLFTTHVLHEAVAARFRKLTREAPGGHDVFLAFDATGTSVEERRRARALAGERLQAFRAPEVLGVDYPDPWADRSRPGLVPGNLDLLYLDLARTWSGYRHYWILEYDVAFTGDWSTLFGHFEDASADLMGTTIHPYGTNPRWTWWRSFRPGRGLGTDRWLRGLFPIVRISRDALRAVDHVYRAGWSGHAEAVMPTAARAHGLEIRDLGGDGPYVAEGDRNRFYTNTPKWEWLCPGTFVYRPSRPAPGRKPDMLWHPVKPTANWMTHRLLRAREWLSVRLRER